VESWRKQLEFDPLPPILSSGNDALCYFTRRDLLNEKVEPVQCLWRLRVVERTLAKQMDDGAWKYPGGGKEHSRATEDYDQLETFRILGQLVVKHGLNKKHPAIKRAANYLFSRQTKEGDFRGIYGNQYTPNYSAAIMELLIKAGYDKDPRIKRGFRWLVSIRQNDGGWAIPLSTVGAKWDVGTMGGDTIEPDVSKPFSHMVTGVVLRAFAAHKEYSRSKEAMAAGKLLASRLFKKDTYPGRQTADFWTRFSYPFWFTDLLSALDSLSLIGFARDDPQIERALEWFIAKQQENGVWQLSLLRGGTDQDLALWVSLAICRVFKRLYG
jgi:Squalene-hopene cyclase C-terminal domain